MHFRCSYYQIENSQISWCDDLTKNYYWNVFDSDQRYPVIDHVQWGPPYLSGTAKSPMVAADWCHCLASLWWELWVGIQIYPSKACQRNMIKRTTRVQVWSRRPTGRTGSVRYTCWEMTSSLVMVQRSTVQLQRQSSNVQRSTPTPKWLAEGMGGRGLQPTWCGCSCESWE